MIRRLIALAMMALMFASIGHAGNQEQRTYELYSGANAADSSNRVSYRINVRGASRVYFRVRSQSASAWTTSDSIYCDSLSTFAIQTSDSVSFIARDSLGTIVTMRNFPGNTPGYGNKAFPICADSTTLSVTASSITVEDTLKALVAVGTPATIPLRQGGVNVCVAPAIRAQMNSAGLPIPKGQPDNAGLINVSYMWLVITPTTRLTFAGKASTQGIRTQGINGLRVTATVVYPNK